MVYSSVGLLALIITLMINHDILRRDYDRAYMPAHASYRSFLYALIAYYITDILWGFLYEKHWITLVYADTVLYFIAMAFTVLFWTQFVVDYLDDHTRFEKILLLSGKAIFLFQIIVLIINFFVPVLFTFDSGNVYHTLSARNVTLAAQVAMFLMTMVYVYTAAPRKGSVKKARHHTIGLFCLIMAVFVVVQYCFPLFPMYAAGCLLGSCMLRSFVLEDEKEEYRDELEKQLRESIRKGNYYDLLTGLPMMTYFFELADRKRDEIVNSGSEAAMLFLDFTGMKFYNRRHGFAEGDRLLKEFAAILIRHFGNENCGRIGGDHFAAITEKEGLDETLNQIFEECREINEGKSLPVHAGIYCMDRTDTPSSIACDRAKLAWGELNNTYSSSFRYFTPELDVDAERRQYIIENLDRALAENWIQVYYQPIVRADSWKVCEEEALARWIDPSLGFLSPADFIPILETAGLIYKLDLYVTELVLKKMNYQKENGITVVPVSVNLSRSDFDSCDIVEEIAKRTDAANVSHDLITIEITESIIGSDFEFIKEQAERFRSLGFPIWIDDFGSGYSSLEVLETLQFDLIKFDMGFTRRLDESEKGRIILRDLMRMANSLGVDTVCEGVETKEQMEFLQEIGCSKLQGYYFCRPIPLETVIEKYKTGMRFGYESPLESPYYDAIGKISFYDLSSIINEGDAPLQGFFDSFPMAIVEVFGQEWKYLRFNPSYREFMNRHFHLCVDISDKTSKLPDEDRNRGEIFRAIEECVRGKGNLFFQEMMPDGNIARCFVRRISRNELTGRTALALVVLTVIAPEESSAKQA